VTIRGIDQSDRAVERALSALRRAIGKRVEAEHLRDGLTSLGSDVALKEWLEEQIEDGTPFFIGFLEVDRFKAVNDKFGYQNADEFLKLLADELRSSAKENTALECVAFRAHGDEFYLAGRTPEDEGRRLSDLFEKARSSIEAIQFDTGKGFLKGTASVGWMCSTDVDDDDVVNERHVRTCLEDAVANAKRLGRNRVVRYDPSLRHHDYIDGRHDCSCGCKFTVQLSVQLASEEDLFCPHCGSRSERPPSLRPSSE